MHRGLVYGLLVVASFDVGCAGDPGVLADPEAASLETAGTSDGPEPAAPQARPPREWRYTAWRDATGLIGTDVPVGWTTTGGPGQALDLGQFSITTIAPDGRSRLVFGHNWQSFMEFQSGPYQPGAATVERFLLPAFVQQEGYAGARVVYRGKVARTSMPSEIGMPIPFDGSTIAFLLQDRSGGFSLGTAHAETLYIASPGTPGLWRLRLFAAAIGEARDGVQVPLQAALARLVNRLDVSPQYFGLWTQAFSQTQRQMREYSAAVDRAFNGYLRSVQADTGVFDRWATMMRGGEFAEHPGTGERFWVGNDRRDWFAAPDGPLVGSDTGPPVSQVPLSPLRRVGQAP